MAEIHLLLHLIAAAADASASEHISEARGQARMKSRQQFPLSVHGAVHRYLCYVMLCVNEADICWLYFLVYFATNHVMHVKVSQLELHRALMLHAYVICFTEHGCPSLLLDKIGLVP